jgi:hypothetical protein
VTVTVWLSSGEEVGGMTQGGHEGSLDINQISRYCGLKMVVGHKISVGKSIGELGGFGGKSLIQVDIHGHPHFPKESKQFSVHFGNSLFLAGFNFRGHFEGPNEYFSR